jgi:hypothetical protein
MSTLEEQSMSRVIVEELLNNFRNTIDLMRDTIRNFDDQKWRTGYTWFQVPVRVARHTIESLDFYFKEKGAPFSWDVSRFGAPYWETSDADQPTQVEVLAYLNEMEARIATHFEAVQDEELGDIYDPSEETSRTKITHYLYALRHTVHHNGSLAALADIKDVPSGDWDTHAL